MSLNPSLLRDRLKSVRAINRAKASAEWSDAIVAYAKTASPITVPTPLTGLGLSLIRPQLLTAMSTDTGSPTTMADALSNAMAAFWSAAIPVGAPGNVVLATPTATSGLMTAFAAGLAPGATRESSATALAAAIDTWTRTVLYGLAPPGGPGPVTPLT
jgi:hypothetical protein